MNHDILYEFFHRFSRILVIIPIVILIFGLIVKLNQNKPQNLSYPEKQILSPTIIPNTTISTIDLNLKGPFICNFSSKEASISGYIKDSKLYGQIKKQTETTNIILNDDCIYFWKELFFTGEKLCGLKPYISMIGNLSLIHLIENNSSLFGGFLSYQSFIPVKAVDIQSLVHSCKQKEIKNGKIFELPKNILFKNKEMPRL